MGVERTVAAPTRRLAVSGRVDRIDDRGAELVVVDYKTGRRGVSVDEARGSLALALYVVGVRRSLRRPCRRVELHHVPTGEVAAFEHTDESLERHVARAEATAEDIVAATDTMEAGAASGRGLPGRARPVVFVVRVPGALRRGPGRVGPGQPVGSASRALSSSARCFASR